MDPIVLAAGTALVKVIVTDAWPQAKDAVTGLWRRGHPQQADGVGTELDTLRADIMQARRDGDADTETALVGAWQVKLQQLLRADPTLATELRRVVDQVFTPALTPDEQTRVQTIITGTASGHARLTQAGRDVNAVHGDQYTAGRDQNIHRP